MCLRTLPRVFEKKRTGIIFFAILLISFCAVFASSSGEFWAEGKRGWVKFFAQKGYVEVEGKGKLWLKTGLEAKEEIEGNYETIEKDGEVVLYKGFQGKVKVTGMNFRVEFRGENIKFHAVGKGKAALKGEGTFKTDKESEQKWGVDYKWAHCRF